MVYAVAQRRLEFGIRMALGASGGDVLRLVARQGLTLTGIGIALGLAGAALTSSLLGDLVVGVRPGDPRLLAAATALLACVAMAACLAPALHAMRIDPNESLRIR